MTEQILRKSLHHALKLDPELCEWFMSRLNLSHKSTADFKNISDLQDHGFDPNSGDMFAIVDNRGHNVALHIIPVLRNLKEGLGRETQARADKMQAEQIPERYESHRVVLVAPAGLVRSHWQAAREFNYWVDFDALTRRQIDRRAA